MIKLLDTTEIGTWLVRVAATAGALALVYVMMAEHHYARGWAAHEAAQAAEVRRVNARLDVVNAELSRERLTAGAERQRAVDAALAGMVTYCHENPAACGAPAPGPGPALRGVIADAPPTAKPARPAAPTPFPASATATACGLPPDVLTALNRIQ